jgi:hypothetical protein
MKKYQKAADEATGSTGLRQPLIDPSSPLGKQLAARAEARAAAAGRADSTPPT